MTELQAENWIVLIVDDEEDNLGVAEGILDFYGATIHTALDGVEGLEKLNTLNPKPTFILLDLSMPEMDGWEMLKRVKEDPETKDIPIIALTAHAMVGDAERALQAGFTGYITKPIMLDEFIDQINACIS